MHFSPPFIQLVNEILHNNFCFVVAAGLTNLKNKNVLMLFAVSRYSIIYVCCRVYMQYFWTPAKFSAPFSPDSILCWFVSMTAGLWCYLELLLFCVLILHGCFQLNICVPGLCWSVSGCFAVQNPPSTNCLPVASVTLHWGPASWAFVIFMCSTDDDQCVHLCSQSTLISARLVCSTQSTAVHQMPALVSITLHQVPLHWARCGIWGYQRWAWLQ